MTMYFSKDLIFLDTVDSWVGTLGIYVLAMIQLCVFSYIFGVGKGIDEAHEGAHIRIPGIYKPILAFVSPLFLVVLFAFFSYNNLPTWISHVGEQPAAKYAIGLIVACIVALCAMVYLGEQRLEKRGIGLEGIDEPGPSSDSGPAGLEE